MHYQGWIFLVVPTWERVLSVLVILKIVQHSNEHNQGWLLLHNVQQWKNITKQHVLTKFAWENVQEKIIKITFNIYSKRKGTILFLVITLPLQKYHEKYISNVIIILSSYKSGKKSNMNNIWLLSYAATQMWQWSVSNVISLAKHWCIKKRKQQLSLSIYSHVTTVINLCDNQQYPISQCLGFNVQNCFLQCYPSNESDTRESVFLLTD